MCVCELKKNYNVLHWQERLKIANIVPYSSCCVSGNIKGGRAWIGGTDERSQGVWEWTDGSPWGYENWRKPSEPNNLFGNEDCTIIWGRTGKWFDVRCDGFFKAGYVCSYNLNGKKFTQGCISITQTLRNAESNFEHIRRNIAARNTLIHPSYTLSPFFIFPTPNFFPSSPLPPFPQP